MPSRAKKPAIKKVTKKPLAVAVKKPVAQKIVKQTHAKRTHVSLKKPEKKSLHLGMHLTIATSAILVLMLLGIVDRVTFATLGSKAAEPTPMTIGIEHEGPVTLSVLVARKQLAGYTSIINQSNETVHISVPSDWKRSEVTGVPLADVVQDIPVFGFTRWKLPAHAGIKMLMDESPASLFFDSSSLATAAINLQTIDLTNLRANSKVVLLKNQALVQLWGNEE